jgi:hypothetical protein
LDSTIIATPPASRSPARIGFDTRVHKAAGKNILNQSRKTFHQHTESPHRQNFELRR